MKISLQTENDFEDNVEFKSLPKVFTFIDFYIRWSDKIFGVELKLLGIGVSLAFEKEG